VSSPFGQESVHTLVVGASQSGLATGYHLKQRGIDHLIVDGNVRVGDAWRNRWDSLRLFTPGRYDGLPGIPYPGAPDSYPTKDEMADYLESYSGRFELPVRCGVSVDRLSIDGDRFSVYSGNERLSANNVIVATGSSHTPRIPAFSKDLDVKVHQLHSSEYRTASQVDDGPVLVVGAGNSGAEIALDVSPGHETLLSGPEVGKEPTSAGTRPDRLLTPFIWFMASHVLSVDNPIGRKARDHFLYPPRGIPWGRVRQKDLMTAGVERVPRIVGVDSGHPALEDGRILEVSTVVWCTGFEPGFDWIELPIFDEYGWPRHDRGVVATAPGLYFMGLQFQHTLSSALVGGVGRDAAHVVDHIARHEPMAQRSIEQGSPLVPPPPGN
jgi:putative flavoprotein involved in K+ transport